MSGTITLPSGDKLITQTEILGSGALVHREEVVVSGTISGRLALPTNSQPAITSYGLPVWEINDPKRVALVNAGVPGTPLRVDPTGTTTQPVSISSTVTVSMPGTPGVIVTSLPAISFSNPQPISSVAGTVQVAFTPSAVQSVNLLNVGFAGTPLRVDPTGTTTQPVSLSGSISLADYSRYSEQQIQTTSLQLVDDVVHVINAALGKVAAIGAQRNDTSTTLATEGAIAPPRITSQRALHVNFRDESGREVGTAGTPLRFDPTGTTTQPVSIAANVNIGAVAGTVNVVFAPSASQNVNLLNVGFAGTPLRIDPTGTTTQPVSLFGSISLADYARYSEQLTQSSRLSTIDTDILATTAAIKGTQAVSIFGSPSITFSGAQPISTVAGTVQVAFTPASVQSVNIKNAGGIEVGTSGTPIYTVFSSPQSISTIAGTVQVAFTPASIQSVSMTTAAAGGTVLALYSEQQTQTTALQLIDDVVHVINAALGKIALVGGQRDDISTTLATEDAIVPFRVTPQRAIHSNWRNESGREIGTSGTPIYMEVTGGVTQPVSIAANVNIGAVAGTVNVTFAPAYTQNVNLLNVGFAGTPLRVDPTGTTTQPVSIAGTLSIPDYARYSEQQTQTTSLQLIDDTVHAVNAALGKVAAIGGQRDDESITLATENAVAPVRITSYRAQHVSLRNEIGVEIGSAGTPLRIDPTGTTTQPISFVGQQPIHGTVIVNNTVTASISNTPAVTFSGQQPIHGTIQINGPLGGGVEAAAVRVTLASDSTGLISIDDNNGSITVDGTVNALLQNVGFAGTPLRVDPIGTTTQPISWTGVPTVSIPGTITANIRNNIFTYKTARIDISAPGDARGTLVLGIANKRIKAYAINMNTSRGGTVSTVWMDGSAGLSGTQVFIDREGYTISVSPPSFLIAPQIGTPLVLHVPAASSSYPFNGGIHGWIGYWDDDSI